MIQYNSERNPCRKKAAWRHACRSGRRVQTGAGMGTFVVPRQRTDAEEQTRLQPPRPTRPCRIATRPKARQIRGESEKESRDLTSRAPAADNRRQPKRAGVCFFPDLYSLNRAAECLKLLVWLFGFFCGNIVTSGGSVPTLSWLPIAGPTGNRSAASWCLWLPGRPGLRPAPRRT